MFVAVLVALLLIKTVLLRQLRRLASEGKLRYFDYAEQLLGATSLLFLMGVAALVAISQASLSARQEKWLAYGWMLLLILQIALWANRMVSILVERAFDRHREVNPSGATHLILAGLAARVLLWSVAALVALDNLGFNITTLMASLGIGGIAVALAVQNILGDVFSSVSIALDKPFVIGDFIIVDDYMGTVEYVGLKTTRIRSLGGEQIIFSNSELLKNRIRNYKRMQERRVVFGFGIEYETSTDNVERIPHIVKEIVSSHALVRFDRAHFKSYGESELEFEVVYYMLDPDYNKYMDVQQSINLLMLRQFREIDIAFAYPTRKLYVSSLAGDAAGDERAGREFQTPVNGEASA